MGIAKDEADYKFMEIKYKHYLQKVMVRFKLKKGRDGLILSILILQKLQKQVLALLVIQLEHERRSTIEGVNMRSLIDLRSRKQNRIKKLLEMRFIQEKKSRDKLKKIEAKLNSAKVLGKKKQKEKVDEMAKQIAAAEATKSNYEIMTLELRELMDKKHQDLQEKLNKMYSAH